MKNRRFALRLLSGLPMLAALPATAFAAALREGIDYVRAAKPVAQPGPGIDVIEFFSYGCPHCKDAEGPVTRWRSGLPKDATFRRVPISFGRANWAALAKLYLALETTGDLAKLHHEVFAAVHEQKLPLKDDKTVMDWAAKRVADAKKFTDTYNSFGIQAKVKSAEQTGLDFGISSVPSFGVGGRYLVVAKDARSLDDILRVASEVIELARKTK